MSVCLCGCVCVLAGTCIYSLVFHVRACQCVGNKEIRHREGVFKSSPTSQCHSNSLHLTQRNHNRGSRGIPHQHMTDSSRPKGNSTLKLILCTGGIYDRHPRFIAVLVQLATKFSLNTRGRHCRGAADV